MHGALVGWLWIAVQWHTSSNAPAVAVLWDLPAPVDTIAAPPQPAPVETSPPPPPKTEQTLPSPDIAVKAEKPRKTEQPQQTRETPAKKPEKSRNKTPSAQELRRQQQAERQHQDEMARLTSQAGAPGQVASSGGPGRPSSEYEGRVRAAVKANLHFSVPDSVDDSVYVEYLVELIGATGEQAGEPQLTHPSGLPGYDEAVRRAILRTDPFPRRADGTAPRELRLQFRPTETR